MLKRKNAVVRTRKYGKLIRISVITVAIALFAGGIAYGWQQYEEEKYPEGTEMDYSLPNAFINFARLINDFITQNVEENDDPETGEINKTEEKGDTVIIVGSEEPEPSEETSSEAEPEEPEIRGGIVSENEISGFYDFKDSLFVGDYFVAQAENLGYFEYTRFAHATGLDMSTILTKKEFKLGEDYVTLSDYAASFENTEAVYIMISAESISWMDVPTFVKKYTAFVDEIVSSFPEAHIYIQPILPINEEKAAKRGYTVTNEAIEKINEYIFALAEERSFWILDMAEIFKDDDGKLPEEFTTNGIRFEKDTYELWSNYIVTHKAHK